jgi:hypothetical protein
MQYDSIEERLHVHYVGTIHWVVSHGSQMSYSHTHDTIVVNGVLVLKFEIDTDYWVFSGQMDTTGRVIGQYHYLARPGSKQVLTTYQSLRTVLNRIIFNQPD